MCYCFTFTDYCDIFTKCHMCTSHSHSSRCSECVISSVTKICNLEELSDVLIITVILLADQRRWRPLASAVRWARDVAAFRSACTVNPEMIVAIIVWKFGLKTIFGQKPLDNGSLIKQQDLFRMFYLHYFAINFFIFTLAAWTATHEFLHNAIKDRTSEQCTSFV